MAGVTASFGFDSKRLQASRVSIHYAESPQNGPPLILLHGLSRDWTSFSVLFAELAPRFHIFALDLRGHGESGRVKKNGYGIGDFGQDVSEFVQAVIPAGAAVFGHSLGAMAGMCAAAATPAITALIVGDSLINPANLAHMYDPLFSQLHTLLLRGGSEVELARGIGGIQIQFPWDPERILPRIQCPVLLLQGNPELDALLSDSDAALAKRLLPRAEHVKFPLLGHALFMQNARAVLDVIVPFLDRCSRS